jgi:arginyl-tRNA synthetase
MNVFSEFRGIVVEALNNLVEAGQLPAGLDYSRIACEPPKESSHGDVAINAAMVLAKPAGMNPRALADLLEKQLLKNSYVAACDIAGPGFVNLTLTDTFWQTQLQKIIKAQKHYGDSKLGQNKKVNVEYVSTNPTGPMHVGHSRGAIVGDILVSLLKKTGYQVTKEFYVNDAGAQVIALAHSVYKRYCQALGMETDEMGAYGGDYLIPVGEALAARDGDKWIGFDEIVWMDPIRDFALEAMMELIKEDLALLKIHHDVFTSEQAIIDEGGIEAVFSELESKDLIYVRSLKTGSPGI